MKNYIVTCCSFLLIVSCSNTNTLKTNNDTMAVKTLGGDRDKHGCISSAGQTWSTLKNNCIQVFNVGTRLNPIQSGDGAIISAFVVYNDDKSKIELFLPGQEATVVINKSETDIYEADIYKYDSQNEELYVRNEKKYVSEKK